MTQAHSVLVGISLGTYSCSVSHFKDGHPEIIPNEDGDRFIPSVITFTEDTILVGTQAKIQAFKNPRTTICDFIGVPFVDFEKNKSFDKESEKFELGENFYSFKELLRIYLSTLKVSAETYLGNTITGVVLSIPFSLSKEERLVYLDAAKEASLNVIQLLDDSSSSMYHVINKYAPEKNEVKALVVDIGYSSLKLSTFHSKDGLLVTPSQIQHTDFGSSSLTRVLYNHFSTEFKRKTGIDINDYKKSVIKMKNAIEKTKMSLSNADVSNCFVESLAEGVDFSSTINRNKFEFMSESFFNGFKTAIVQSLNSFPVDMVILTGASARIPKIQLIAKNICASATVIVSPEPEADSVNGAATQAQLFKNLFDFQFKEDDVLGLNEEECILENGLYKIK
ncbi:Heat shock protein 70 family domain-containing protein [Rozella allomycis CSF55]|uniref:Heat shock protein 70 family domain-containing protein n=1 Tax=Rozella allomycis (strain CSF55) TaxID=988480 RepID=A0A075AST3_ROZAC|nr:Heat shock protein 70 family domain-containing protein [Rozella allomycis CSF55]|eukprot:EPZ33346.1 Heat shock protein 70 family domain-containing protein [Rozella allomycis CSF55]